MSPTTTVITVDTATASAHVREMLRGNVPLGVAYSGGVDSATLLAR